MVALAPDREVLKAAHLELARIWSEQLGDLPRALVSLQAVLALDEDHPEALGRLADVAARSGDLDKSAQTLRRLVDRATTAETRAAALVRASEVHQMRGDTEAAKRATLQALAVGGPESPARHRHLALVSDPSDWEAHAEALRAWLAAEPRRGEAARDASLEIARIYRDELGRTGHAVEALERAVRAQPSDAQLRRALAVDLRHARRFEEALAELRSLLSDGLGRAELWRELSATLRAAGDLDGARRALEPLVLLGAAHGEEARDVKARKVRAARARPASLDGALLEALYPVRRASALVALLRLLTPVLGKLYPPDFESFGISSRDRLSTRSPEPIRQMCDRVAAIFGAGEVHLYSHRTRGRGLAVELTSPPSVLVPSAVAEMREPHQAFTLARAMANITVGLHAVDKLTPRELEIVLAAAARRVVPGFGTGLTSEDVLEDVGKRLHRALSRRARKDLEELARALRRGGPAGVRGRDGGDPREREPRGAAGGRRPDRVRGGDEADRAGSPASSPARACCSTPR
ncbi:MAG: tetratricopeptide repeat protein [Sandaracinaceae bacterium]|nr:tetratricopeptide repeat protein [Sandaracinaceae bacterium]